MNERRVNYLLDVINRNLEGKRSRQEASAMENERTTREQTLSREQDDRKERSRNDAIAARMMEQQRLIALRTSSERPERYNPEMERDRQNTRRPSQRPYQREYSRT